MARDVLHAVKDLALACNNLANYLVPGGALIVVDMDQHQFSSGLPGTLFCDAVFGCFREWCSYTDDRTNHCTLTPDGWTNLLAKHGFENISITGQHATYFSHIVIQAQRAHSKSFTTATFNSESSDSLIVDQQGFQWKIWTWYPGCESQLVQEMCSIAKRNEDIDEEEEKIGIVLINGDSPESHASKGFLRSFKREYPHMQTRLVQLAGEMARNRDMRISSTLEIIHTTEAAETKFDESGTIWVPLLRHMQGPSAQQASLGPSTILDQNAAYLVAGGCSSMGLHIIEWMYRKGARRIVATSRRGPAFVHSLAAQQDKLLHSYLEQLDDLDLNFYDVDATNKEAVSRLCKTSKFDGVIYMAAAFADKPLEQMTVHDFQESYDAKSVGVCNLFDCLGPDTWFLAMSSLSSLVGNAGAANYASANTRMESLMNLRRHAIAILLPSIANAGRYSDLSVDLTGKALLHIRGAQDWERMAISIKQMTLQLEDALLYLLETYDDAATSRSFKTPVYIGPVPFHILAQHEKSLEPLVGHLIPRTHVQKGNEVNGDARQEPMRALISDILHIPASEINASVPLRVYGVDSIVATRLISTLSSRYDVHISQLELLGQVTLQRLEEEYRNTSKPSHNQSVQQQIEAETQSETLVKLNTAKSGRPIFFIHGGGGAVNFFKGLSHSLQVPVWGLQETSSTSKLTSARQVLEVYISAIRKVQPKGPYRLAAFCLGATWVPLLVEMLHGYEEEVDRMCFIDGSPTMFTFSDNAPFVEKSLLRVNVEGYRVFAGLLKEMLNDKEHCFPIPVVQELLQGLSEQRSSAWVERFFESAERQVLFAVREYWDKGCVGALPRPTTLAQQLQGGCFSKRKLMDWLRTSGLSTMHPTVGQSSSIPICIIIMSRGIATAYPVSANDLDLSSASDAITAIHLEGSHYNAFTVGSAANARAVQAMNAHFGLQ